MQEVKVAVIGGGINGLCSAWALAQAGFCVTLFERGNVMEETSSASSKLLHGGLRYLENSEFRLVKEALRERNWWINNVPELAQPIELIIPILRFNQRSRAKVKLGLVLYDFLAGSGNLGKHHWYSKATLGNLAPDLKSEGLQGGYAFFDGQMDDYRLGLWIADRLCELGVAILDKTPVERVMVDGKIFFSNKCEHFDSVVNATGPWAGELLKRSGIDSLRQLDLVRGSHIYFEDPIKQGYVLEGPDGRIFFVLPYKGRTLVGTTEVRQELGQEIGCSEGEAEYLLNAYNRYFKKQKTIRDITGNYSGLRPLLNTGEHDPGKTTREYAIERQGRVVTIFGGKWTTARQLGMHVCKTVEDNIRKERLPG